MLKFCNFEITKNGNLRITLTSEGKQEISNVDWENNPDWAFYNLIEYQLCNGWEEIEPEEIGALTEALILSDDCVRDDNNHIVECGRVYSNIEYYAVESDIARLLRKGELIWRGSGTSRHGRY